VCCLGTGAWDTPATAAPWGAVTTGRLEAFSDGVFAIAITLLVLDLHVPRSSDSPTGQLLGAALLRQWPAYFAYATSFVTILIMWVNHHHIIARLAKADHTFLFLNGLLLMAVSVVPFPTSIPAEYLQRPGQTVAAAVYTGTFVVLALVYNLWWHYATADCSTRQSTIASWRVCRGSTTPLR
jgi:uncharacterized membrane protein